MAKMRRVNSKQCERSHRDNDRPNFRLHQSFNCFQGDRAGTCSGDGGSPLVCPIKNSDRYMQVSVIYLNCKPDINIAKIKRRRKFSGLQ